MLEVTSAIIYNSEGIIKGGNHIFLSHPIHRLCFHWGKAWVWFSLNCPMFYVLHAWKKLLIRLSSHLENKVGFAKEQEEFENRKSLFNFLELPFSILFLLISAFLHMPLNGSSPDATRKQSVQPDTNQEMPGISLSNPLLHSP